MEKALALYRGAFLEGFFINEADTFQDWIVVRRERLHQRAVDALHALIAHFKRRGEIKPAIAHAQRLAALDPWREEAHAALIELLALDGQRSAALKQYETCRAVLMKELGVEPQEETVRLYEAVRSGSLPEVQERSGRVNLPVEVTSFIGRESELAQIADLLQRRDARLVTLVGMGGAGKTRLALQAARESRFAFSDGVFWVALGGLDHASALPQAIAESLGFAFASSGAPRAQLLNYLRQKNLLLVFDNYEHLLDGAELAAEILQTCPNVTALATSREPLRMQMEWTLEVGGFGASLPAGEADSASAAVDDSLRLFEARAKQTQASFALAGDALPHVRELCQILGGLPLGIELAAGSIRQFTPSQICEHIRQSLGFLSTDLRDVPDRHRSLRAVFDHSWKLLTEEEQAALGALAIFRGGFTDEAANHVANAQPQTLAALAKKMLLQRDANGHYDMHELIRQFALETLAERDTLAERHSGYYLHWLAQNERPLRVADVEVLRAVSLEMGNVRAAWDWSCQNLRVEWMDESSEALMQFYDARSLFVEAEDAFRKSLEELEKAGVGQESARAGERQAHAKMLGYAGWALQRQGNVDEARRQVESCFHIIKELNDSYLMRVWQRRLGYVCYMQAEHELAERLARAALESARIADDELDMQDCLSNLTLIANQSGQRAKAVEFATEQVAIARRVSPISLAFALNNLGLAHYYQGVNVEARKYFVEAAELCRKIENRHALALALNNLGIIEKMEGNFERAIDYFQQALAIQKDIGGRLGIASNLSNVGSTLDAQEDFTQARTFHLEALAILREISHRWGVTLVLNSLANNSISLKDYDAAKNYLRESLPLSLEVASPPLTLNGLIQAAELLRLEGDSVRALELAAYARTYPELDAENVELLEALWGRLKRKLSAKKMEEAAKSAAQEARPLQEVVNDALQGM
ncbi:MAG: tetratricopeptide repeat protein [Chloroflexota bacterium]